MNEKIEEIQKVISNKKDKEIAMKNALGTLIEPLTVPEKQNTTIIGLTPRDRDRAMTELINRMKG